MAAIAAGPLLVKRRLQPVGAGRRVPASALAAAASGTLFTPDTATRPVKQITLPCVNSTTAWLYHR
jgi:hypothetical protein